MSEPSLDRLDEGLLSRFSPMSASSNGVDDQAILRLMNREGQKLSPMGSEPAKLFFKDAIAGKNRLAEVSSSNQKVVHEGREGHLVFLTEQQIEKVITDSATAAGIDVDPDAVKAMVAEDPQGAIDKVAAVSDLAGKNKKQTASYSRSGTHWREYALPGRDTEVKLHGEDYDLEAEEERLHADLDLDNEFGEDDAHAKKVYAHRNPRSSGSNGENPKGFKRPVDRDSDEGMPMDQSKELTTERAQVFSKVYKRIGENVFTREELKFIFNDTLYSYDESISFEEHCLNEISEYL